MSILKAILPLSFVVSACIGASETEGETAQEGRLWSHTLTADGRCEEPSNAEYLDVRFCSRSYPFWSSDGSQYWLDAELSFWIRDTPQTNSLTERKRSTTIGSGLFLDMVLPPCSHVPFHVEPGQDLIMVTASSVLENMVGFGDPWIEVERHGCASPFRSELPLREQCGDLGQEHGFLRIHSRNIRPRTIQVTWNGPTPFVETVLIDGTPPNAFFEATRTVEIGGVVGEDLTSVTIASVGESPDDLLEVPFRIDPVTNYCMWP